MGANSGKIKIELIVDPKKGIIGVKQFSGTTSRKLKETADASDRASSRISAGWNRVRRSWLAISAVGAAAIYGTIRVMKDLVTHSGKQEQAVAGMEQAMRSMGRYTPELRDRLIGVAKAQQDVTTFGDEATIEGQKFLLTYREIGNEMLPRASRAMLDLAALMGGDTRQAANMLGKASMGMTGELRRVGITVSQDTYKMKGFLGVLEEIEAQVRGQAVAMANTGYGGLQQLGNLIGDVKEKAGDLVLLKFEDTISSWAREVKELNKVLDEIVEERKLERYQEAVADIIQGATTEQKPGVLGGLVRDLDRFFKWREGIQEKAAAGSRYGGGGYQLLFDRERLKEGIRQAQALEAAWTWTEEGPGPAAAPADPKAGKERERQLENLKKALQMSDTLQLKAIHANKQRAESAKETTKITEAEWVKLFATEDENIEKRAQAYRDLYFDLKGQAEEEFEFKKGIIEKTGAAYMQLGVDIDLVNQWMTQQTKEAWVEMARAGDDFFDGMRARLMDLEDDMMTWGEAGYNTVKGFTDSSRKVLKTGLTDAYKGEFDDIGDYWRLLMDSMYDVLADTLSRMASEWLTAKLFSSGGSTGGSTMSALESFYYAHAGGVVGRGAMPTRKMPAALLAYAPRLHGGLRSDEYPAILQRGEEVLKKGESRGISIHVPVTVNGASPSPAWISGLSQDIEQVVDNRVRELM